MKHIEHPTWRKSSHSTQEGGQCVELADLHTTVGIRDSKDPQGPILHVHRPALAELLNHIKTGHLDR